MITIQGADIVEIMAKIKEAELKLQHPGTPDEYKNQLEEFIRKLKGELKNRRKKEKEV